MTDSLQYVKYVLLLAAVLIVFGVDYTAGLERSNSAIAENKRDLALNWQLAKQIAESKGLSAFPLRAGDSTIDRMAQWETMEAFLVNSEDAKYLSSPVLEPTASLVRSGKVIDCWTEPVKSARNGNTGVTIAKDAREVDCITAFGLVTSNEGNECVLIFKMDKSEAVSVAPANYWDEIGVSMCCFIVGSIVFFVHRVRKGKEQEFRDLEIAAAEAIAVNEHLRKQLDEKEALGELADEQ